MIRTLIVAVVVLGQVYPIVWVALSSFKSPKELASTPAYAPPTSIDLTNYVTALTESDILRYLLNSTVVAVLTLGITVVLAAPAAFAIEKLRFRLGGTVLAYFLLGVMIPVFVALLPTFQVFNSLGLRNTYWALVLPQVGFGLPIAVYLYTGFMRFIPNSLIEAAAMDGAGPFQVFARIIFPLAKNTTITIVTFNFVFVWNEFVFANTFMSGSMLTVPVGLNEFVGLYGNVDWGATYAAIVISLVPTLILYFFLNKQVIEGMAAGAVRG